MIMLNKKTKFIIAIIAQIAIILVMVLFKLSVLKSGADVLLKIMPVDPRDPLRGDYITFQYNISNINGGYFVEQPDESYAPQDLYKDEKIKIGDTVYVPLQKIDNYYDLNYDYNAATLKQRPTDGHLFIKGVISGGGKTEKDYVLNENIFQPPSDSDFSVLYGVEQYFIPENVGRDFSFFNKEIFAKVAIDTDGNAVLKQIYIDGKTWP